MIGIEKPSYLDIGAHHPIKISNTALLYLRGSRGINIEANPSLFDAFQKHRPEDINLNVGVADASGRMTFYRFSETSGLNTFDADRARYVEKNLGFPITSKIDVDVTTVSEIVERYCGGKFPDYLTLDVEGLDFRILNSIPYEKYAPKLINVEANHEADARAISRLLREKGYRPHFRMRGNLFFLQDKYASASIPVD
jgi:FkbM family methyltransferase